jgi:SAM-dependent methyltransferase
VDVGDLGRAHDTPGTAEGDGAYAAAGQHYTSPTRRDWVKRTWEEPAFRRHLDTALRQARAHGLATELDVLDVGCGTGVALDLLLTTPALTDGTVTLGRATGVDLDDGLLEIARARFAADARFRFTTGDLMAPPPTGPHDLVLSSGVPFSHLEPDELERSLARLMTRTRASSDEPGAALLVVDVLGRYSLEWTSRWAETRWDYRMSFFATDTDVPATPMTTWSGEDLTASIERSCEASGTALLDLVLVDRSLAVGRHTMTGEYTPDLPRLRDLVDELAEDDADGAGPDPAALRLTIDLPEAPPEVLAHHAAFADAWNSTLDTASAEGTAGAALAERLRTVESGFELAGLGVGHSLTAFAVVTGA